MKKRFLALMSVVTLCGVCAMPASAASDYTIVSPYADVVWSGDEAWGAYRGTLHSHTTWSDADIDLATMVKEYYALGYDFLANSDHSVTGVEWNKTPVYLPLYAYQGILGHKKTTLTDQEYADILSGAYNGRGYGMTCVTGANELNNLSVSKNHVNGYFDRSDVANGFAGREYEVGLEDAIRYIDKNGGLSHINHPGDLLDSNAHPEAVKDPDNVACLGDLILKYKSCLGTEVLNEVNSVTRYDRVLWDELLMYCLPYGKTVLGYSNTDAHSLINCDSSFSVFMMKENTAQEVKKTMQNGAFFCVTKCIPGNDVYEIGPKEHIDVRGQGIPYPMFKAVEVSGHTVTITAEHATQLQWIADGNIILQCEIGADPVTLDLDTIAGSENFRYIRAELLGEGGLCLSQALVIDNGTAPLDFDAAAHAPSLCRRICLWIRGTKLYTIAVEILRAFR